jgi:hypothetical protein
MNLEAKLFLNSLAYGSSNFFRKGLEDLLFVVIDGNMGRLQMFNIDQHLKWICQCYSKEIQLVQSHLIFIDALEKRGEQRSVPVKESASGRLAHIPLPIGYNIDLPGEEVKSLLLIFFKDVIEDQALAMINHSFSK